MYATQAPSGSSDDDDDSIGLSQTALIVMSVVFSFVGGGVVSGVIVWFWMNRANKDPLLVK